MRDLPHFLLVPEVFLKKKNLGSAEMLNKILYDVLGAINGRWKARIDWRNYINGFDMFAVPARKGKLEKMSVWTSSRCDRRT